MNSIKTMQANRETICELSGAMLTAFETLAAELAEAIEKCKDAEADRVGVEGMLEMSVTKIRELEAALRDLIPVAMNEYPEGDHPAVGRAERLLATAETPADDLNRQPLGKCNRCGRKVWKRDTIGAVDEMRQPDTGGKCGGTFRTTLKIKGDDRG